MHRFSKIIAASLLFVLLLSACSSKGKPERMTDRDYELGLAAVEDIDAFIAGDITAEEAADGLNNCDILSEDVLLGSYIFSAKIAVQHKGSGTGVMKDVSEARDKLADYLNVK